MDTERKCETCRYYLGNGCCRLDLEDECAAGAFEAWEGKRMTDREKVIKGLECCMSEKMCHSPCPYNGECEEFGYYYSKAIDDALAMLKAQEPRVMTLEDIRVIYHHREDHVWPFDTPPYLWVETNGRTAPYWMSWSNVIACLEGQYPKYDPDDYGKTWRLLTSRPDEKVRAYMPWVDSLN